MRRLMSAAVLFISLLGGMSAASAGAIRPGLIPVASYDTQSTTPSVFLNDVAVRKRYRRRYRSRYPSYPRQYRRSLRFRNGYFGCRYRYSGYFTGYPCWSRRVLSPPRYR